MKIYYITGQLSADNGYGLREYLSDDSILDTWYSTRTAAQAAIADNDLGPDSPEDGPSVHAVYEIQSMEAEPDEDGEIICEDKYGAVLYPTSIDRARCTLHRASNGGSL